ncbi:hypothetical protein Y032_0229g2930 [Ancylostoma ceylanicum]|uniref:Uncharacterized protein n=1 Tax=Ancylostoma ceylanicum TaxID=53326 RepID=A0A016SH53_9BILA|nr:hypothetical protein Y032_0229g2930 [Ancylostoma ceylanicum]
MDGRVVLMENEQISIALVLEEQELDAEHFTVVGCGYTSENKGDVEPSFRTEDAPHHDCATSKILPAEALDSLRRSLQIPSRPSNLNIFK